MVVDNVGIERIGVIVWKISILWLFDMNMLENFVV